MSSSDPTQVLSDVAGLFGVGVFKEKQDEAIRTFLSGRDTFVSLPTGYGKSIIYAALPLIFDRVLGRKGSIVVCVNPLTSLMIDQRSKFEPLGMSVKFVDEAQEDQEAVLRVLKGEVQLVFISPETIICNPQFRSMLLSEQYKKFLVAFVVDEAHCVKTWWVAIKTLWM